MAEIITSPALSLTMDDYRGLSAYEIAVKNGFEGSESEWLASLKGADGLTHAVNGVEEIDGNILLTGADIPVSLNDRRSLSELAQGMDQILNAISVSDEAVDLGGRILDNAVFR